VFGFPRSLLSEIDEFKETRLAAGVEPATINHDLRVLRRMMRLAERKQLISFPERHDASELLAAPSKQIA
jgi:hypothetical protein